MSPSPPGRCQQCHPHPLAPTAAAQHPDNTRAHGGAARGHPHLGQQGQVQQETCPGGEPGDSGGDIGHPSGSTLGPQGSGDASTCLLHPTSSKGDVRGGDAGGRPWAGSKGTHCAAGHCPFPMGMEMALRDILAPRGVFLLGLCTGRTFPATPAHWQMATIGVISGMSWVPSSAIIWPPKPGGCSRMWAALAQP